MKYVVGFFFCLAMLFSCNDSNKNSAANDPNLASVELSIEGMSCEKMCGAAIQKGLEKIDGVASTELEFSSENPVDKITVKFDPNKVSTEDMTKKVEGLAGGAYKVKEVK